MSLIGLLLLVALVIGVWLLVLDKDSPFNRRRMQAESAATAAPTATIAPEATPAETEVPATPEPVATPEPTAEPTPEVLPTPTAAALATTQAINNGDATAEPVDMATAVPLVTPLATATARPTDAPTAEPVPTDAPAPTAEPAPANTPVPTDTPDLGPTPKPTPRYYYPLPATRNPNGAPDRVTPSPRPEEAGNEPNANGEHVASEDAVATARITLTNPGANLNLRTTPSTAGGILASVSNGTVVDVLGYEGDWMRVRVNGQEGYMGKNYLTVLETPTPEPQATPEAPAEPEVQATPEPQPEPAASDVVAKARITLTNPGANLNMRATPSTAGEVLTGLPNGTDVDVLGFEGDWAHVRVNGMEGYVSKAYLTVTETLSAQAIAETGLPYLIEVDRGMQVVRVYTIDENGGYTLLAREMICSTDSFGYKPPNGTYAMDGERQRWLTTFTPGSYAQYATRITGHILFHSVPYQALRPDALDTEAYAVLGTNASIGCVRLLCADAKWIYDNVPAGTVVKFMTGERDEAKLAELAPPPLASGLWDPTDDNESNPDYSADYENAHPFATPVPNVTPAPTAPWTPDTYV